MYIPIFRVQLVKESRQAVERKSITSPQAAAVILHRYLRGADREMFVVMGLTTKNQVIGLNTVSVGSLDAALIHPREIYKPAILMNAASILLAHNHPSGDPTPSPEDRQVTARLVEAGRLLGIEVIDHLILGEGETFLSLKERGLM